ncbi:MAG: HIT family protein [Verrucomicrobiota bacterium]|nr:HIT family protein [Verrucomicrobiota bacterium]
MSADCVFCKIAGNVLPSTKVYEDRDTLAFLDVGPVVKGHVLVIPRQHYDPITGAPPEVLQKLIVVVQKVARALIRGLGAGGVNISQANGRLAGQVVPHIHFHVIPRFEGDGHARNWVPKQYENPQEMGQFGGKIRDALG